MTVIEAPPAPAVPETSTPLDPSGRSRLRNLRIPALVVGLVILIGLVTALIESGSHGGYLDPKSASPSGGMALRVLLEQQGVDVQVVGSAQSAAQTPAGSTLLVASADLLSSGQLDALSAGSADLVLLDPSPDVLDRLAPQVQPSGEADSTPRAPVCSLSAAQLAGTALTGGLTFSAPSAAAGSVELCYPDAGGGATLVQVTSPSGRTVTVLGSGDAFTNGELATEGDAALALNLLGRHAQLTWYVATPELGSGTASAPGLLPSWVKVATLQVVLAVIALAFWRGRRLGPVVVEPLPVVVRAAEATEGRARLYRRSGARDRAAQHLRAASLARLVPLLGVGRGAERATVCEAAAARSGWPAAAVDALVYGAAPSDDRALVQLATNLDTLERTVRRT
jgi:hypothetical protein